MNRKEAREAAFKVLFAHELVDKETSPSAMWRVAVDAGEYEEAAFSDSLMNAISAHEEEIEQAIEQYAVGWKLSRISPVSRAILKIAICELFYMPDIPKLVSLNEAIELSKTYDDEKAYVFVNGVLHSTMSDPRVVKLEETV